MSVRLGVYVFLALLLFLSIMAAICVAIMSHVETDAALVAVNHIFEVSVEGFKMVLGALIGVLSISKGVSLPRE